MVDLAVFGATGRMGRRLVALAEPAGLSVVSAISRADDPLLGQDAGQVAGIGSLGVPINADGSGTPKVMIDFSLPAGFRKAVEWAQAHDVPLVVGTTGLTAEDHAKIDVMAKSLPVLQAPNMSLGVNLLFALAAQVSKKLQDAAGTAYDIEIIDVHHNQKVDAPSGTAMGLVESICDATGRSLDDDVVYGRHGESKRNPGEVSVHALRMGSVVGDHDVHFASEEERLTLTHHAETRDVFARGALVAAKWLVDQPAGRYSMADVLEL